MCILKRLTMLSVAFATPAGLRGRVRQNHERRVVCQPEAPARAARNARAMHMCEPPLTEAEKTRNALSATKPLVKFKKDIADGDTSFTYTSGVGAGGGGVDVWLITGILFFVVPVVGFAVGVATGNIDVNPR